MKLLLPAILALLLNGCSGSLYLSSGGGAPAPSPVSANPTTGPNGLRANVNTAPGPWFSALILGLLIAEGVDHARQPGQWTRAAPEADESRRISVQDCTRPVDLSQGNLSCR